MSVRAEVIIDGPANEVDATILHFGHHRGPVAMFEYHIARRNMRLQSLHQCGASLAAGLQLLEFGWAVDSGIQATTLCCHLIKYLIDRSLDPLGEQGQCVQA